MQKRTQFRDYQEQVAGDHNNLQDYARESLDDIVKDLGTTGRKYSEFLVSKTGQIEVTVAPGRFFDAGAVFKRGTSLVQSMSAYTAGAAKRIVAVSVYGQTVETDVQQRDFVINTTTLETEPQSVSMTISRECQIVFTPGSEAADPVAPPVPATHAVIAYVLMDTTQILSVTMQPNRIVSTDELDVRARALEAWRAATEPKIAGIQSDIADLANRLAQTVSRPTIQAMQFDIARVKAKLSIPAGAAAYGADYYLLPKNSDTTNLAGLGYDALVEEGIRFPTANASQFEIGLFSANDPNASLVGGVLVPRYTEDLKLQVGPFSSELGISQYGFQTLDMKQGFMSRMRVRYGGAYSVCTNGAYWDVTPGFPAQQNLYDFATTDITSVANVLYADGAYTQQRKQTYWIDQWKEPFSYTVTQNYSIQGAQVAQSFLVPNDTICTKLGFYITGKAAAEDIHIALCEITNGVPDLDKLIYKGVYPHASIVENDWNRISITPTFLRKGKRLALVFVSNANHKIGMASGQAMLDGTFFYSTDGSYFLGDLTKDMMIEIWGAKFNASQVTIEFGVINLDGGFRNIDILAQIWEPDSTKLIFEMRPGGSGDWMPVVNDNGAILATAPALAQFRARYVGTRDVMPMLRLTGSRVKVSRPKTAFREVSKPITVPAISAGSNNVTVKVTLESFDETPHDHSMTLRVGSTDVNPATTVTKALPAGEEGQLRWERTYTFTVTAGTTSFRVVQNGATTGASSTYHVGELDYATT